MIPLPEINDGVPIDRWFSLEGRKKKDKVKGEVHAHDLEVHGQLDGTVHCTGTLSLRPGCQFKGVLRAGKLVIYPGAVVDMDAETAET